MFNPHSAKYREVKAVTHFFKVAFENSLLMMSMARRANESGLIVRVHCGDEIREIGKIDRRGFFTANHADTTSAKRAKVMMEQLLPVLYNQGMYVDQLGCVVKVQPIKVLPWDGIMPDALRNDIFERDAERILAAIAAQAA